MYSSVLLKLTACLLYSSSLPLYSGRLLLTFWIPLTYTDAARTRTYRKHITWSLPSQPTGPLAGPTRNTCHVTATYSYVTPPRRQRKHSFPYCCARVFRAWPGDDVLLLLRVGTCWQSCGLEMGIHVTIYMQTWTKWCFNKQPTKYCVYRTVLHICIKCSTDATGCSDTLLWLMSVFLIKSMSWLYPCPIHRGIFRQCIKQQTFHTLPYLLVYCT
jgi:hypothetical protein